MNQVLMSASKTRIALVGGISEDAKAKCSRNQLETVQDIIDIGRAGCEAISLGDDDVSSLNQFCQMNSFPEIS